MLSFLLPFGVNRNYIVLFAFVSIKSYKKLIDNYPFQQRFIQEANYFLINFLDEILYIGFYAS